MKIYPLLLEDNHKYIDEDKLERERKKEEEKNKV